MSALPGMTPVIAGGKQLPVLSSQAGFNMVTGSTADIVRTGVGFSPKIIIFQGSGTDVSGGTANGGHIKPFFGIAVRRKDGTIDQWVVAGQCEDAQGTSDTDYGKRSDACIMFITTAGALEGYASVASFDSDGFTLSVPDAVDDTYRITTLAIGGEGIEDCRAGEIDQKSGTGTQAYTGIGFKPSALFMACAGGATTTGGAVVGTGLQMAFGFAHGPASTEQAYWYGQLLNGQSGVTVAPHCVCKTGQILGIITSASAVPTIELESFDTDGFTLDYTVSDTTIRKFFYAAIKGGYWDIGTVSWPTNTTPFDITGIANKLGNAFTPGGSFFVTAAKSTESAGGIAGFQTDFQLSFGIGESGTARRNQGCRIRRTSNVYQCSRSNSGASMHQPLNTADSFEAQCDTSAYGSGTITVNMDTAGPNAYFGWFVAFGPAP